MLPTQWPSASERRIVLVSAHRASHGYAKALPQAGFLARLQQLDASPGPFAERNSPLLAGIQRGPDQGSWQGLPVGELIQLLKTRQLVLQAAFEIEQVADELRRCQRFSRPGQPSATLVRIRQQQASVRHAASVARQHFVEAAAVFVRAALIEVPARLSLEAFILHWIDLNLPADISPRS